jgi:hypothetical protein
VGTQLRLVEGVEGIEAVARRGRPRRAEPIRRGRRAARWPDWRLDDRARRVGREGIAQARAALAQAQQGAPQARLPKAS